MTTRLWCKISTKNKRSLARWCRKLNLKQVRQAYANASISGSRVFLCHLYRQAGREHLLFSVPCSLLLQLAQSQRTKTRKNKSFDSELINRPISPQHVNEIAKYLLETENYILPPFIFNCRTPIKIFAYGVDFSKTKLTL